MFVGVESNVKLYSYFYRTLELCLTEAMNCHLFVGILGERYGWVPEKYMVPDQQQFDWLKEYPQGASVTELEMHCAALVKANDVQHTAFFYLRNNAFEK